MEARCLSQPAYARLVRCITWLLWTYESRCLHTVGVLEHVLVMGPEGLDGLRDIGEDLEWSALEL